MPPSLDLEIARGDVLVVTGSELQIEWLTRQLGQAERPIHETDLGGLLLSGPTVGFLRTRFPGFGGAALVLPGVAVTTLPLLLGFAFGRYALRLHPRTRASAPSPPEARLRTHFSE